jgi:hypothetical protein
MTNSHSFAETNELAHPPHNIVLFLRQFLLAIHQICDSEPKLLSVRVTRITEK